jgi:ATP adenylyltransferase
MEYIAAERSEGDGCIFCEIPKPGHPQAKHVVERAELTYTVLNLYPYSGGHVMVVPYRHAPHLTDLEDAEAAAITFGGRRAIRALERAMAPQGFNLGINHGQIAGAGIVEHVHMHVVPRWGGDTNFMPVLADVKVIPESLDRTAEKIRGAYDEAGA